MKARVKRFILLKLIMSDWDQKLRVILKLRAFHSEILLKVFNGFVAWTLVDQFSFEHKHQLIEFLIDVLTWLMDSHDYGLSLLFGKFSQIVDDNKGSQGIETWSRFIQHHHLRVSEQLKSDRSSFLLSSWYSLDDLSSDQSVHALLEFHILWKLQYFLLLFLSRQV